jgi:cyclophilin family peptidyl-prolyl cis-trans isomerase
MKIFVAVSLLAAVNAVAGIAYRFDGEAAAGRVIAEGRSMRVEFERGDGVLFKDGTIVLTPDVYRVQFDTTKGSFLVQVTRKSAPRGAERFYELVRSGFFDDSRVFRVRRGFIAQFGIAGNPKRNARWTPIADDPVTQSNARGTMAFAMTGPNTRLTQVYINLGDNRRLDADGFAPIGRVVEGMDVVDKLYAGYGENSGGGMRGGKQAPLLRGGNKYLDAHYPKLDRIIRARVIFSSK